MDPALSVLLDQMQSGVASLREHVSRPGPLTPTELMACVEHAKTAWVALTSLRAVVDLADLRCYDEKTPGKLRKDCATDSSVLHPASNAPLEKSSAYHDALKQDPLRWRACPLLRIEPDGHFFWEIRACSGCSTTLARPVRILRLAYLEVLFIPAGFTMEQVRREALMGALRAANGSLQRAAEILGVSRRTAYNGSAEFGLSVEGHHG